MGCVIVLISKGGHEKGAPASHAWWTRGEESSVPVAREAPGLTTLPPPAGSWNASPRILMQRCRNRCALLPWGGSGDMP